MYKSFVKRGIVLGIIMLMLFGSSIIPFVNSADVEDAVSIRKNSNLEYPNPLVVSSQPTGEVTFYFFVRNLSITFHGNVDHFGLEWSGLGIRLRWVTDDPVTVSGLEGWKNPFEFYDEDGMDAVALLFTGYDGIQFGRNQSSGNVSGRATLFRVIR